MTGGDVAGVINQYNDSELAKKIKAKAFFEKLVDLCIESGILMPIFDSERTAIDVKQILTSEEETALRDLKDELECTNIFIELVR
jgi:hypothetical protein